MKPSYNKPLPTCVVGLPLPTHEFVFAEDRPFAFCHTPTLVQLADSSFLVAWTGGPHEGHPDTAIWCANRSREGWSEPRMLVNVNKSPHLNPVLYRDEQNILHLWFKVGVNLSQWRSWYMVSHNEGRSWTPPEPYFHAARIPLGPVRSRPIRMSDGTLLAGFSDEQQLGDSNCNHWLSYTARSSDNGASWHEITEIPQEWQSDKGDKPGGMIQPALWESAPGMVHALLRTTCGVIYRSDSNDGGRSWCQAYATALPHNNSGIDLVKSTRGPLILACNPVAVAGVRTPLRLLLSHDNGDSWPQGLDIERGAGEYSSPALIETPCGIAVAHTWRRQRIAFWHGTIAELNVNF